MKIAICFSGMIRTGAFAAPSIINFIGNLMPQCDFFMHTWDISEDKQWHFDSKIAKQQGVNTPLTNSSYNLIENFLSAYPKKFSSIKIQNFNSWKDNFFQNYRCFSPLWYSWYESIMCKRWHESTFNITYDYVVKLRPDIIFPTNYKLQQEIDYVLTDKNSFYAMGYSNARVDDVLFIASNKTMDKASEFINNVKLKVWTTNIFGEYLKEQTINCKGTLSAAYAIYRQEALGVSPLHFNRCFNIERDFYSPESTIGRLPE